MKEVIVISTSLRHGSNSDMRAEKFVEGAKAAGIIWKHQQYETYMSDFVRQREWKGLHLALSCRNLVTFVATTL